MEYLYSSQKNDCIFSTREKKQIYKNILNLISKYYIDLF